MNLYLISQSSNIGYDTYDRAVVAATSADDARLIHPDGKDRPKVIARDSAAQFADPQATWVEDPKTVLVREIGKAGAGVKRGVVLASYRAD